MAKVRSRQPKPKPKPHKKPGVTGSVVAGGAGGVAAGVGKTLSTFFFGDYSNDAQTLISYKLSERVAERNAKASASQQWALHKFTQVDTYNTNAVVLALVKEARRVRRYVETTGKLTPTSLTNQAYNDVLEGKIDDNSDILAYHERQAKLAADIARKDAKAAKKGRTLQKILSLFGF